MCKLQLVAIALMAALVGRAQAPAHPDFAGQWTFVKEQSELGGFTSPDSLKKTISFQDPNLRVHTVQTSAGKTTVQDMSYYSNGFETKNFINGLNAYSKASWTGQVLTIHTNLQDSIGGAVVLDEQWVLGEAKGTLTVTTTLVTTKGTTKTKSMWKKEG